MSQLNRNAHYLFTVDGITVWERLRVIRNFIIEREQALKLAELNKTKYDTMDKASFEAQEKEIFREQEQTLIEECRDELMFLKDLEQRLATEAEPTRLEGKSDKEMYEINYFEELIQLNLLTLQSELLSTGVVSPSTMKMLLRNPQTLERATTMGLVNKEALPKGLCMLKAVTYIKDECYE